MWNPQRRHAVAAVLGNFEYIPYANCGAAEIRTGQQDPGHPAHAARAILLASSGHQQAAE